MSVLLYKVGICRLRFILKQKQLTQMDLAIQLGVTIQQINKYYHNRQKMSIEVMKNIAEILNCQMEDLYEWIEVGDNE